MSQFVKAWFLPDVSVCDDLIEYHKTSSNQKPGVSYDDSTQKITVNKDIKDSIDVELDTSSIKDKYLDQLQFILTEYVKEFPFSQWSTPCGLIEKVNIQHYPIGGGFKKWHCERSTGTYPGSARHLVFMTYLNDVKSGGETEFYHQDIKVKPVKGLTVIWPADWTHTHRGVPSFTEEKYIVTGWISFLDGYQDQPVKISL